MESSPLWLEMIRTTSRAIFDFYHSRRLGSTYTFYVMISVTNTLGDAIDNFFFTLETICGVALHSFTFASHFILHKVLNPLLRGYISACYWTTLASVLWLWAQPIQTTVHYLRQENCWEELVIAFAILASYVYSNLLDHMLFSDSPRYMFPVLPVIYLLKYSSGAMSYLVVSHPLVCAVRVLEILLASWTYFYFRHGILSPLWVVLSLFLCAWLSQMARNMREEVSI